MSERMHTPLASSISLQLGTFGKETMKAQSRLQSRHEKLNGKCLLHDCYRRRQLREIPH